IFTATAHMHDIGRGIFTLAPGGNILSQKNFDYDNQSAVAADVVLKENELTWTVCRWENTKDIPVSYGEETGKSEMCYVYAGYYPRITDPSWNWNAPTFADVKGDEDPRCLDWPEVP